MQIVKSAFIFCKNVGLVVNYINPTMHMTKHTLWGCILCGIYVLLAFLVHNRILVSIDLETTTLLQQIIPRSADLPSSVLSLLGSVEITILVLAALLLLARPTVRVRLVLLFALVALLELQGKTMIVQPPVPDALQRYVFAYGTPTGSISTEFSFPSGHSARTSFLVATAIALVAQSNTSPTRQRVLTALLLVAAAVMLVSRVYIGDHWLTDVIGGALIGVGLALFALPGEFIRPALPKHPISR